MYSVVDYKRGFPQSKNPVSSNMINEPFSKHSLLHYIVFKYIRHQK